MFDLQRFLEGLDLFYASGKGREAEGYLKRGLKEAASCGDDGAILAILNELMGYYRAAGRYEECLLCTRQAMELADELGPDDAVWHDAVKCCDGIPCRREISGGGNALRTGIRNLPEVYYRAGLPYGIAS